MPCVRALVAAAAALAAVASAATQTNLHDYVYVYSGKGQRSFANGTQRAGNDYLSVLDFEKHSMTYGRVVARVDVPGTAGILNEPRELAFTADGLWLVGAGFFGVTSRRPDLFVFNATNLAKPEFAYHFDVPGLGCASALAPHKAGLLVSLMCDERFDSPGGLVFFDPATKEVREFVHDVSELTNPSRFTLSERAGLVVVGDFGAPVSFVARGAAAGDPDLGVYRDTVQAYDARTGKHRGEWRLPLVRGVMDNAFIPHDPHGRIVVIGGGTRMIYLLRAGKEPLAVFDLSNVGDRAVATADGSRLAFTDNGHSMIVTYGQRWVLLFDMSDPEWPSLVDTHDLGDGSYVSGVFVTPDARRAVVVNYYIEFDDLSPYSAGGHRSVHVFNINDGSLALDGRFQASFYDEHGRPVGIEFAVRDKPHRGESSWSGSARSQSADTTYDDDDDNGHSSDSDEHRQDGGYEFLRPEHCPPGTRLVPDHHKILKKKAGLAHLQGKSLLTHQILAGHCEKHHESSSDDDDDDDEHHHIDGKAELAHQQGYIDWAYKKSAQPYAYGSAGGSSALYSTTERRRSDVWDDDDDDQDGMRGNVAFPREESENDSGSPPGPDDGRYWRGEVTHGSKWESRSGNGDSSNMWDHSGNSHSGSGSGSSSSD